MQLKKINFKELRNLNNFKKLQSISVSFLLITSKRKDTYPSRLISEAATKGVLRNLTKFTETQNLQETLAQVFSCEFCEISKNTFFTEHLWKTASVI